MVHLMDKSWKKIYDDNALKDLPDYSASCWTEDGFLELFKVCFKIVSKLKNVKSVLDVGCGFGSYCAEFKRRGFSVVGLDYAKNVVAEAALKNPEIKFVEGDAYNLPFDDNSFDLVVCIGVLQCVYDSDKIIKELCRVSKKYVLVSTLLRRQKLDKPLRVLEKKLETDSWPTRDYHPSDLEVLFVDEGFFVTNTLSNKGSLIKDGFFTLATKKP